MAKIKKKTVEKSLDVLSKINWGLDFSHYKRVVSGTTVEDYFYEKSVHFGGTLSPNKAVGERISGKRRAFSISRARLRIRRLIEANRYSWGCKPIFITYTYSQNVKDLKTSNADWVRYCRKLNSFLGFSSKYLAVVEFQSRGAVHYHVVYFNIPFIPNIRDVLTELWGHGIVLGRSVRYLNSIGAYLSKYLQKGVIDSRLFDEKCYFTSRGLLQPFITRNSPLDLDFGTSVDILELKESRDYSSRWTGRIDYKRYKNVLIK